MKNDIEIVEVPDGFWVKFNKRVYKFQLTPYKDIPVIFKYNLKTLQDLERKRK